ncbi:unnamed protein product [Psylliodes chrysocephalus]|uniref:Uncharacterized protein n=1 Tax=Psylliodes chrysocephalus TaxID=3402493 RepID=A0A9P0CPA9_9CUCU|nr:unnamed protein product [Psylliodes chrysocephala]
MDFHQGGKFRVKGGYDQKPVEKVNNSGTSREEDTKESSTEEDTLVEYEELQTTQRSKTDLFLDVPIVNRDLLFNPNCYIGIIIDYLIEEVGIPKDLKDRVDLTDEDGKLLEVKKIPPYCNGLEFLQTSARDKQEGKVFAWRPRD